MSLKIIYDGNRYNTDIDLEGTLTVRRNPFCLEYDISSKRQRKNIFSTYEEEKRVEYRFESEKPLSEIDNLFVFHEGIFKLDVKKGRILLFDRPLQEYLTDFVWDQPEILF